MRNKIAVGYRITQVAIDLVIEKSKELGVSKADVVEMAIREFAKKLTVIESNDKNSDSSMQSK